MERIYGDSTSPRILGLCPPKDVAESPWTRPDDFRDGSESKPIGEAPAGRLVPPRIDQPPRRVVEDLRVHIEERDGQGLFLEVGTLPEDCREAIQVVHIDVPVRFPER